MSRAKADLALVINAVIWGATFVTVKQALADVSPLLFLALRFSLAALVLLLLFRRKLAAASKPWVRAGAICGSFLFAGYAFQTIGLRFTTPAKSAFLTGLCTVMVPLLAALVYRNRPRPMELAGVACAMAGMGLMTLDSATLRMGTGDVLTLICAVAFAAHIVTLGHYSGEIQFELLAVAQVGVCALLALGLFWWAEPVHIAWRPAVGGAVLITGLLATAFACTVQAWAQQYTTATRTALILMLEPIFAWVTSWLVSGETLSVGAAAGAALIVGGVLLVEMKPWGAGSHP